MKEIRVIRVTTDQEFDLVYAIRKKVFVEEQKVPEEDEYDGNEHISHHYLALLDDLPCGAARWRITQAGKIKLERFAVLKEQRNAGIGSALVKAVLSDIPRHLPVYLNAQVEAIRFYEMHGFIGEGELFDECGIMHQKMTLPPETI